MFLLEHIIPGGAARAALGQRAIAGADRAVQQAQRLRPADLAPVLEYCRDLVLHFNLGYSYKNNQAVSALIGENLPEDARARRDLDRPRADRRHAARNAPGRAPQQADRLLPHRNRVHLLRDAGVPARAAPDPLLRDRPPRGSRRRRRRRRRPGAVLADPRDLVLPVFSLAAITIAGFSRYMRSSMMEAMTEDYVRTAQGEGREPAARALPARAAERADPDHHAARAVAAGDRRRRADHRDRLQLPGHGPAHDAGRDQQRRPAAARHHVRRGVATVAGSLLADILYAVADPRVRYA